MNRFVEFADVDLTIEEHHAHPAYGSTRLKSFLSPERPSAGAADRGNAVHLLAMFPDRADEVLERPPFNKGEGIREKKRLWLEEHKGHYSFPAAEYRNVIGMAAALRECKPLRAFLEHPRAQLEQTVLATTDTGIVAKARTDIRGPGKDCRVIVDVKTTGEADDDGFAKAVARYGYDMQGALYGDIERQRWDMPVKYYLYAVQVTPPHRVLRMRLPDEWLHIGRMLYEAAFIKAEIAAVSDARLPFHWEGSRVLPPPGPWVSQRAERILDHARKLHDQFERSRT